MSFIEFHITLNYAQFINENSFSGVNRVSDSNRNSWRSNIEYYSIKYSNSSNTRIVRISGLFRYKSLFSRISGQFYVKIFIFTHSSLSNAKFNHWITEISYNYTSCYSTYSTFQLQFNYTWLYIYSLLTYTFWIPKFAYCWKYFAKSTDLLLLSYKSSSSYNHK